jgi:hypothetical protein
MSWKRRKYRRSKKFSFLNRDNIFIPLGILQRNCLFLAAGRNNVLSHRVVTDIKYFYYCPKLKHRPPLLLCFQKVTPKAFEGLRKNPMVLTLDFLVAKEVWVLTQIHYSSIRAACS